MDHTLYLITPNPCSEAQGERLDYSYDLRLPQRKLKLREATPLGVLLARGSGEGEPGRCVFSKAAVLPSLLLTLSELSSRPGFLRFGK